MLRRARYREPRHGCRQQQDKFATPGGYVWARGQEPEGGSGPFAFPRGPYTRHRQSGRDLWLAGHVSRATSGGSNRGAPALRRGGGAARGSLPDEAGRAVL